MIEILMFFSLGFLAANLVVLAVIPFVHSRAERLTVERLEASIPVSIAEVHASKDILRAEFAVSTRRMEMTIEHLRSKMMDYARELSRKTVVSSVQPEIDSETASLEGESSRSTGDRSSTATGPVREAKDVLIEKEAEIAKLTRELDERSRANDAQRVELVTLKIQIEDLTRQLADSRKQRVQELIAVAKRREGLRLAG